MENNDNVYIKRGPDFLKLDDMSSQKLRESIERILALRTEDNAAEVGELLDKLFVSYKTPIFNEDYYVNYEGTGEFWIREDYNNGIVVTNYSWGRTLTFSSEEELNNQFINLKDFMKNAEYIGRYFLRTEPLVDLPGYIKNDAYMSKFKSSLVIYSNGAYMLTVDQDPYDMSKRYGIIESRFLYDSKYKFIGVKDYNYENRDEVYEDVCAYGLSSGLPFLI